MINIMRFSFGVLLLGFHMLMAPSYAAIPQVHNNYTAPQPEEYDIWRGIKPRQYLTGIWKLWRIEKGSQGSVAVLKGKALSWWESMDNRRYGMVAAEMKKGNGLVFASQALAFNNYTRDRAARKYVNNALTYILRGGAPMQASSPVTHAAAPVVSIIRMNGRVRIDIPCDIPYEVSMVNLKGALVMQLSGNKKTRIQVDSRTYPSGVYLMHARLNGRTQTISRLSIF